MAEKKQTTPDVQLHEHPHKVWFYVIAGIVVIVLAFMVGISLSHGNSDIACTQTVQSGQGLCTDGSWGSWTTLTQTTSSTGEVDASQQRTYTGLMASVSGNLNYTTPTAGHPSCDINLANSTITGTIITTYSACQIQESRTVVVSTGSGGGGNGGSGNGGAATGTVLTDQQTTTIGGVSTTTSTAFSGSYQDYLNAANEALATSQISATPSLLHPGDVTHVNWSSSHVSSCQVSGSNGDAWTGTSSDAQGQTSSPINQQVIYTLTCTTASGKALAPQQAVVNIIPTYKEN